MDTGQEISGLVVLSYYDTNKQVHTVLVIFYIANKLSAKFFEPPKFFVKFESVAFELRKKK